MVGPQLNKGVLDIVDKQGCVAFPHTCAALDRLVAGGILSPTRESPQVGARLLRLAPGAVLRPHHGPGGRFVAHLGVSIPDAGARLVVGSEPRSWHEGEFLLFADEVLHWAENRNPTQPRVVLHLAFAKRPVQP